MQAARRVHYAADLAGLQRKRSLFELLLHVPSTEEPEVPTLPGAAAVRLGDSQVSEGGAPTPDALLVSLDDFPGLFFASGNVGL